MKLRWLLKAELSLGKQLKHIARDNPVAAVSQGDKVLTAVERLPRFPEPGRPGRVAGTRELVVPGTPFIVAYAVEPSQIVVIRVLHGAQKWPECF